MLMIFLLATLGPVPSANIDKICQTAQVDSLPEDRANALRGCKTDEASARDQLKREWGRFSAADKANCVETPGMKFSYVELLTCLEMQRGGSFGTGGSPGGTPPAPSPITAPTDSGQKP